MTLTTERLILRGFETSDWERVHIYGSDAEFCKYEIWGPNTVEETQQFIARMISQQNAQPRYKYDFAVIPLSIFRPLELWTNWE